MKRFLLPLIILVTLFFGCDKKNNPSGAGDITEIEGTWIGRLSEFGTVWKAVVSGSTITLSAIAGSEYYKGTFTLNTGANPKTIDFLIIECDTSLYVAKTSLGIYKISNDTLTMSMNEPGKTTRPASYTDPLDAVWILVKYVPPTSVPAAPTLTSPADNATYVSSPAFLQWNAVATAESYKLEVSTSSTFATVAHSDSTLTVPYKSVAGLGFSTLYYWRVRAKNALGYSSWSSTFKFTTANYMVGSIYGTVTDAVTGFPIVAAAMSLYLNSNLVASKNSLSDGSYTFTGLAPGTYSLTATKTNYINGTEGTIVVGNGQNKIVNMVLSPVAGDIQYRIVLTWGILPKDLDAHLIKGAYHIFYGYMGYKDSGPFTTLDVDDTSSYGPETITIYKMNGDAGKFFVHNYSGDHASDIALTASQAVVKIYSGSTLVKTYNVPTSGTGSIWYVFDIAANGTITDKNIIQTSPPTGKISWGQKTQ
jgi:uncharacterized protein (TIGR03067 family)